jgi:hypothetical protein
MPPRIYDIAVTVPPGTPSSAPQSTKWVTENNTIVDIELEVPPGHNGLTGIRIVKGDVQLIPWSAGTFIVANDYTRVFAVGAYIPTTDMTIQAYNTGAYPHTFYLRMTIEDYNPPVSTSVPSPSDAIPADSVTAAPDPLSPDAILGADSVTALNDGTITVDDLAPVDTSDLTLPPVPDSTVTG